MKNLDLGRKSLARGWQASFVAMTFLMSLMPLNNLIVRAAAAPGAVVINEVAWAGTADLASDEWMELYNTTDATVDLSGWKIKDNGVVAFTFPAGASIASHAYALLEDRESAVADVTADFIYNMSLANAGDTQQLVDNTDVVIDTVNGSGGMWYAGSISGNASMERKDAAAGDVASNFATSKGGSGAHGAAGSVIMGTPKAVNSVSAGAPVISDLIKAAFVAGDWQVGQVVKLDVSAENVTNLFAYGYELDYDPAVLDFQSVAGGAFLSNSGNDGTSFQSGLMAGQAGKLLVAEARTVDLKTGVAGSGLLFEVSFVVKAVPVAGTDVVFANGSFSSSPSGDLGLTYLSGSWGAPVVSVAPVTALALTEGTDRYQIKLTWTASVSAADNYRVERKNAHGQWVILGTVTGNEFVDEDGVAGGGQIVPKLVYAYRVTALKAALASDSLEISGQDGRGIKGDNDRSDLVDGRDLERLALHFAENDQAAGFDLLVDTTYDGLVNGSDLIDLGASFAQKY